MRQFTIQFTYVRLKNLLLTNLTLLFKVICWLFRVSITVFKKKTMKTCRSPTVKYTNDKIFVSHASFESKVSTSPFYILKDKFMYNSKLYGSTSKKKK